MATDHSSSSPETDRIPKCWQVWALMFTEQGRERWIPVSMLFKDKRTADRLAEVLWLITEVQEVDDEDDA